MSKKQQHPRYAEGTTVPIDRSRQEIENLLRRHGATGFLCGWEERRSVVQCMLQGRMLRHVVLTPTPEENGGATRAEREHRRRWRALLLILKAKLELVAGGDSTLDREFLADIVLPDGSSISDKLIPQIASAYETGEMPRLLGGG